MPNPCNNIPKFHVETPDLQCCTCCNSTGATNAKWLLHQTMTTERCVQSVETIKGVLIAAWLGFLLDKALQ